MLFWKKIKTVVLSICVMLSEICSGVAEAGDRPELQLFSMVAPYHGKVYGAGVEFGLEDKISFLGSFAKFTYEYRIENSPTDKYWENGDGRILGGMIRFYDQEGLKGSFFGLGMDHMSATIDYGEDINTSHARGQTKQYGGAPHLVIGHRWRVAAMSIEPLVRIERLPTDREIKVVAVAGFAVGARF